MLRKVPPATPPAPATGRTRRPSRRRIGRATVASPTGPEGGARSPPRRRGTPRTVKELPAWHWPDRHPKAHWPKAATPSKKKQRHWMNVRVPFCTPNSLPQRADRPLTLCRNSPVPVRHLASFPFEATPIVIGLCPAFTTPKGPRHAQASWGILSPGEP